MAFKKGEGGRKAGAKGRVTREVRELFCKLGGPDGEQYAQQLHNLACLPHDEPQVRVKALSIIAPYVWGKPKETVAIEGAGGGPVLVRFVDA